MNATTCFDRALLGHFAPEVCKRAASMLFLDPNSVEIDPILSVTLRLFLPQCYVHVSLLRQFRRTIAMTSALAHVVSIHAHSCSVHWYIPHVR